MNQSKINLAVSFFAAFLFTGTAQAGKDFLIVANGPFDEEVVIKHVQQKQKTIIALDGAAKHLYDKKISPHYILGDFDSLEENLKLEGNNPFKFDTIDEHFKLIPKPEDDKLEFETKDLSFKFDNSNEITNESVIYVRASSQNYTDLEKGIRFCVKMGAENITLSCALGGIRTDHSLGNMAILKRHHGKPYKISIETTKEVIQFLKDENVEFQGTKGAKFGLFGFPKAIANSKGLRWELDNYSLELGGPESSCNELVDTNVKIQVKGEALMMRPNY